MQVSVTCTGQSWTPVPGSAMFKLKPAQVLIRSCPCLPASLKYLFSTAGKTGIPLTVTNNICWSDEHNIRVFSCVCVYEYFMVQYFPDPRSEFSYQFSGPWHFIFLIDSNLKIKWLICSLLSCLRKKGSRHLYNSCLEKCHDKLQHRSEILLSEELNTSSLIHKYEKLGAG